jgi:ubiquinone/menaquinone biosynthesis C-methylase UbiE
MPDSALPKRAKKRAYNHSQNTTPTMVRNSGMTETSAHFIGDIPENYDQGLGPHIFEDYAVDITGRAIAYAPNRVLELAAGTGIVSKQLHNALPKNAQLVVTDLSSPMLKVAQQKFPDDTPVTFKLADAMQLPFDDNAFDLVVCQFGVMFFPEKQKAFREARRVLCDGGHIVFNVWGEMTANPFSQVAFDVSAQFFPDNPPLFYQAPFSYSNPKAVAEDLAQSGFSEISHKVIKIEKEVCDWRLLARGLVFGNPLIEEIKQRGDIDPESVMTAVETVLQERFGAAPATMPLEAILFSARRPLAE